MFKVTFKFESGEDVTTFAQENENLLEVARKVNVAIDAPCGGNASCGKCKVKILEGNIDSPKTRHISDEEYNGGWRLACVSKVTGDVAVQVPDIASAYRSRMKVADLSSKEEIKIFENAKNDIEAAGIALTNSMGILDIEMNVPTLDDTMPDNERFIRAIKKKTGAARVRLPFQVLNKIARIFRESAFQVRCEIRTSANKDDIFVYDVYPKDLSSIGNIQIVALILFRK